MNGQSHSCERRSFLRLIPIPFGCAPSFFGTMHICIPAMVHGASMKFAKIVFWVAAICGLLIISPLYFLFDLIGKQDPPPITHPGFFYGFVGLALVWQITF